MTAERDFRWLGEEPDPERYIPRVASWIHESGNPYYDSFFGGTEVAEAALLRWVARPTSEIALDHVIGLFDDRATDELDLLAPTPGAMLGGIMTRALLLRSRGEG